MARNPSAPGRDWIEVVTQPTMAAFAAAFSIDPQLSASVLQASIFGVSRIRAFFEATRAMYDRIAFVRETRDQNHSPLAWEGSYGSKPIEGVTILERDATGAIARIRLFHLPYEQLVAFADDLALRLATPSSPTGTSSCA
jgi:hypothetical protein